MTITTALSLFMGCCPQGPAGTGKTETVKDLGKNLGKMVLVFNCTPSMGVESMARNLSGLTQVGCWGCFDEFNRITIEVLSVVALQFASIFDAVRAGRPRCRIDAHEIKVVPTVGIMTTMNPSGAGYRGRSELPENLKSMFRPVSMMVCTSRVRLQVTVAWRASFPSFLVFLETLVSFFFPLLSSPRSFSLRSTLFPRFPT